MFILGYLSLVQMFEDILGEAINSCLSYLTFINIQCVKYQYWPGSLITAGLTLPVVALPHVTSVWL